MKFFSPGNHRKPEKTALDSVESSSTAGDMETYRLNDDEEQENKSDDIAPI